ncbi:MAG TPA: carotenoid oxygenase family protein [Steroidobacteraceae bacterium]|nr:carotenoid oxygenase family protein [Steroidobacteraceae bacterium]
MVQRFSDQHLGGNFFQTLRFEGEIRDCEVQGTIPQDLKGTFYRLGGDWAYAPKYEHDVPFSADGYISMFRFANGRVQYKGRFVETPRFLANHRAGKQLFGIYRNRRGDDPSVRNISGTVSNTTPVFHAGKLFATKEDARPYEIDPHTLQTRGEYDFGGRLSSLTFTAHPKIDPATGEMIAFGYEATGEASTDIFIYTIDKSGRVTKEVKVQAPYVSENHDMAITSTHIVIPHFPLTTTREWLEASPANLHWYWDERLPGYLLVLPRNGDARDARWIKGPPAAMGHTLNAVTEGNRLVIDGTVSDANPYPFFPNRDGSPWTPMTGGASIRRWTVDLNSKSDGWEEQRPFPAQIGGLPRIDDRFISNPYRYGYLGYTDFSRQPSAKLASTPNFPLTNSLGRFDMHTGKCESMFISDEGSLQEACFASRSGTCAEGSGYLLGVYTNLLEQRSELLVIDAEKMQEVGRVILPFHVAAQVHGTWVPHEELPFPAG